jgi:hypothetical protein
MARAHSPTILISPRYAAPHRRIRTAPELGPLSESLQNLWLAGQPLQARRV